MGAIYGKRGYMFHAPPGADFSSHIEPIFRDLRKDVKDKNRVQIYVIGGEEVNDQYKDETRAGRQTVLDKIVRSGFEYCIKVVRWCPFNHNQTLSLILSEGRAEIEEDSEEDMINEINGW